ncbi:MAG: hypothetical protein ACFE9L_17930, partial [Candidatus Hodarchaeota archaeon]
MNESPVSPVDESTKMRRLQNIKVHLLAIGIILIIGAFLILQFFVRLRYPPELNLPDELKPTWIQNEDLLSAMRFFGDIGIILGWIILLTGLFIFIYGFSLRVRTRVPKKFDTTLVSEFITSFKTDRNFAALFIVTIIFGILWIFNFLTYPDIGPLYFLREPYIRAYVGPDVQTENLASFSTYGAFAAIQDTAILLIYVYIIYVRLRPGKQIGEDFVNFALERTAFLIVIMVASLYHAIGHLPFELYGRGQWGTGFTDLEAWISFDKIGHMFASIAITMLIFAILTNQFAKYGAISRNFNFFALIVAIAFMITLGLFWEMYEWAMNLLLALIDAPSHFV